MSTKVCRVIPRLDIKNNNLIKGVQFEGLRVIGDASNYARSYAVDGADELLLIDSVASLYGRNNLFSIIQRIANEVFIPVTVGGGIRSVENAECVFEAGADKIALNTAAIGTPNLIDDLAKKFGNQSVVLSIQAKRAKVGSEWECYVECGREKTNVSVLSWIAEATDRGIGELLVTSVDREGTAKGFDLDLYSVVSSHSKVPVLASGGFGRLQDAVDVVQKGVDGLAIGRCLHYQNTDIKRVKAGLAESGYEVRF